MAGSATLGAPMFRVQRLPNPHFNKSFTEILGKTLGVPNANPTMTDPSPYSRLSDLLRPEQPHGYLNLEEKGAIHVSELGSLPHETPDSIFYVRLVSGLEIPRVRPVSSTENA